MRRGRTALLRLATAAAVLVGTAVTAFAVDTDSDTLEDALENAIGTDPSDADTDDDGWSDAHELFTTGTDPLQPDTDGDGVIDSADSDPLVFPSGDPDGDESPTFSGARSGTPWARSGLSPEDGVGVLLHDGTVRHTVRVADAEGVNGLDFALVLNYDSRSSWDGIHGFGWTSDLEASRTVSGSGDVTIHWGGVASTWIWTGSAWSPPAGCTATLTQPSSGTFAMTWPDGRKVTIDGSGLRSIGDRWGNALTTTFTAGRISSVTDSRGQVHSLTYWASGRLRKITAADGAEWAFEYNPLGQLYAVRGPAVTGLPFGVVQEFRYVNGSSTSSLNGNLSGATDGKGQWRLRCRYDTSDRVTEQRAHDNTRVWRFDWSNQSNETVTVTDPAGNERVWTWDETKLTKASLTERTNRNVRANEGDYTTSWTTDSDGYLTAVTNPRGNGTKYTLNSAKLPTEVRRKADMTAADSSADFVESFTYDSSKYYAVTAATDAESHQTTYTLNSLGQPTTVTFPTLTHVTPNVTVTNSYTYNSDGTVASFTDGEGKRTTYTYYTSGARKGRPQTTTVDADGLALQTTYDWWDWGALKSVTDPRGHTTTRTVLRYGQVTQIDSPSALGYQIRFLHDANLNVLARSVKNVSETGSWLSTPEWWTTTFEYTPADQVASMMEPISLVATRGTQFDYDANGNLVKVLREGREVRMTYDERNLLYERIREGGSASDLTERWTYDANRNPIEHVNPRTKVSSSGFDDHERVVRNTNQLGHYETVAYDRRGLLTERKSWEEAGTDDVLLAHHKRTYDAMGRLVKQEDALLGTGGTTWYDRRYAHDGRGLVVTETDRLGNSVSNTYDGAGRRTHRTDALGNITRSWYDGAGNVTATEETEIIPGSTSTEVHRTEFTYDAIGRRTRRTEIDRNASTHTRTTEWKWSSLGVKQAIDPLGTVTTFALDGLGRTTERSVAVGTSASLVTAWTYNAHDDVTRVRDDASRDTDDAYDAFGRRVSRTYANGEVIAFQFDANGNVTRITDANGTIIDQTWDDADRLTARDVTPATGVVGDTSDDFTYDALDRMTEAKDDDSVVRFAYDSLGRLLREEQGPNPLGTSGRTVAYTYDAEGRRTKVDYPSGFDANETRDALGRLTAITDASSNTVASFDLYGAGQRRKKTTFANGTRAERTHDGLRLPTEIAHKTSGGTEFAGFTYGWDDGGRPLFEARSHASGGGDVYTYDPANRLQKALRDVADPAGEVADPGSETYDKALETVLDDVSNVTSFLSTPYQGSTTTTSYTVDSANQVTAVGSTTLVWTDEGSLKDDGTFEYAYDARQRLVAVKDKATGATLVSYAYDAVGRGRRIGRTEGSTTTTIVYAGSDAIEEYQGSSLVRLCAFGPSGDVVLMEAPDTADVDGDANTSEVLRFAFHTQLVGSVTHVTAPDGTVAEEVRYDPWGAPTLLDGSGASLTASAIGNSWAFRGWRFDETTDLAWDGARDYSPTLRRWLQREPVSGRAPANPYEAAGSAPTIAGSPDALGRPRAVTPAPSQLPAR